MSVLQLSPRVSSVIDPVSYAAQSIHSAAGDLLAQAVRVETVNDALRLAELARALRERLDAVAGVAMDRADALIEAM